MGFWKGYVVGKYMNGGRTKGNGDGASGCGAMLFIFIVLVALSFVARWILDNQTEAETIGTGFMGILAMGLIPSLWDLLFEVEIASTYMQLFAMLGSVVGCAIFAGVGFLIDLLLFKNPAIFTVTFLLIGLLNGVIALGRAGYYLFQIIS